MPQLELQPICPIVRAKQSVCSCLMMAQCVHQDSAIVLRDVFSLYHEPKSNYTVELRLDGIYCRGEKEFSIPFTDIVGCHCMRPKPSRNVTQRADPRAFLCIYSYPLRPKKFTKTAWHRCRTTTILRTKKFETFDENKKIVQDWRNALLTLLRQKKCSSEVDSSMLNGVTENIEIGEEIKEGYQAPKEKPVLILVNPSSGSGRAPVIYSTRVRSILGEADIPNEMILTKRANHARDLLKSPEVILKYQGILIVSGDGLVHEVYNGLFQQEEWRNALKFPVGIVPGGSGNGLAKTVAAASREPFDEEPVLISSFMAARGRHHPMDLMLVQTVDETLCSFLSVGWGIIADTDIESEKLRSLGGNRFAVWFVARLINLKKYRGRVSFLRANTSHIAPDQVPVIPSAQSRRENFARRTQSEGDPIRDEPRSLHHSKSYHAGHGIEEEASEDVVLVDLDEVPISEVFGDGGGNSPSPSLNSPGPKSSAHFYAPHRLTIPGLDQPVPSNWETVEDEFILVYVVNLPYISQDAIIAPDSKLDDGILWMILIRSGVPRSQILKCFLSMSNGGHVSFPFFEMIPVRAFRLEPLSDGGHITVDGELVSYGPIQCEILPSAAQVFCS